MIDSSFSRENAALEAENTRLRRALTALTDEHMPVFNESPDGGFWECPTCTAIHRGHHADMEHDETCAYIAGVEALALKSAV